MKSDVTTFTRYFALLILIFVVWLFMIHNLRDEPVFRQIFGTEEKTL